MQGSVKEIKNRIQEEFSRFHNLLDRRQEKLTKKLDKYLSSQNQEKLNLVKFENATEIDSIDTPPPSQLSLLQFIAEETPNNIVDKKPQFFEIKFLFHKDAVEKEIEQCGDIVMEQLAELDTPPQTPQEEQYPSLYNFPSPVVKQESLHDFCDCKEVMKKKKTLRNLSSQRTAAISTPLREEVVQETTQTHFEAVSNLMDNKLRKGDVWCLVSCSWFKKWRQYASSEIASKSDDMNPGPIDNSDILGPSGLLKKDLVQNVDYKLMPDTAWKLLYKKFGSTSSAIRRWVVEYGAFRKTMRVEVYLLALNCQINNREKTTDKVVHMSRMANFHNLENQVKQNLKLLSETVLEVSYSTRKNEWQTLDDFTRTPQEMGMFDGQQIKVNVKKETCKSRVRKCSGLETSMSKKARSI